MILVLAGTTEGRKVACCLLQAGFRTMATAVSDYGAQLLRENGVREVLVGPLEPHMFSDLLEARGVRAVIDATHPYAVNITCMAMKICLEKGIHYIRLERPAAGVPGDPLVVRACSLDAALDRALVPGGILFSTLGSRNLARVVERAKKKNVRVIARVLPDPEVIAGCLALGLSPGQIVAAQGPFSRALNREFFRAYGATVVITKESGGNGGVDTKIAAALDLGIPVIVWMRPRLDYPVVVNTPEEVIKELYRKLV